MRVWVKKLGAYDTTETIRNNRIKGEIWEEVEVVK